LVRRPRFLSAFQRADEADSPIAAKQARLFALGSKY
jgi:hypothetical protein